MYIPLYSLWLSINQSIYLTCPSIKYIQIHIHATFLFRRQLSCWELCSCAWALGRQLLRRRRSCSWWRSCCWRPRPASTRSRSIRWVIRGVHWISGELGADFSLVLMVGERAPPNFTPCTSVCQSFVFIDIYLTCICVLISKWSYVCLTSSGFRIFGENWHEKGQNIMRCIFKSKLLLRQVLWETLYLNLPLFFLSCLTSSLYCPTVVVSCSYTFWQIY